MTRNGFKSLNKDMTNQYGMKFEEGKTYSLPETTILTKGVNGTGFHFTPYLEDTLAYVNGLEEDICIATVTALGDILTFSDSFNYYGYDNLTATSRIRIDHIMSREEIINHMLTRPENAIIRFISGYKLTREEINQIENTYPDRIMVALAIKYYQEKDKKAYEKAYEKGLYR